MLGFWISALPFKIMLVPTSLKSAKNSLISWGVTGIERKIKAEKNVKKFGHIWENNKRHPNEIVVKI
jgi:hypothetical protein